MSLESQLLENARHFQYGNFAVHKSDRHFSSFAIDQAHEQEQDNASIKGDGGAIVLTADSSCSKMDGGWARKKQVGDQLRNSIRE